LEEGDEKAGSASLTDAQLDAVVKLGCRAEELFGRPQDVEWAIDGSGMLFALQSRDITAAGVPDAAEVRARGVAPPFLPPGPGAWTQDATHFPKPMTRNFAEQYENLALMPIDETPFGLGLKHVGSALKGIVSRTVNGFVYDSTPVLAEMDELGARAARCEEFWSKRLYMKDLREFDEVWVPARLAEHAEMRARLKATRGGIDALDPDDNASSGFREYGGGGDGSDSQRYGGGGGSDILRYGACDRAGGGGPPWDEGSQQFNMTLVDASKRVSLNPYLRSQTWI